MWSLSSAADTQDHVELEASLDVELERLEPAAERLWELRAERHRMDSVCYVGSHRTEHAVELDRSLLTCLLALPGRLLLDVYPDGESGASSWRWKASVEGHSPTRLLCHAAPGQQTRDRALLTGSWLLPGAGGTGE